MHVGGICASDFAYLERGTTFILGHELAGVRADGTPVMVEGMFGCGVCEFCLEGRNNLCAQAGKKALGIMQDGGMVEQYRVPAHKLIELPRGLDLADASLVEPASVAWHGARLGGAGPGKRVAVVGGGSIGQLAATAAQTQGADDVVLEARYPHQHEIRERFGVAEPEADARYDVVIEAAGSASALQRATELLSPGGTIAVLGVHFGALEVTYPMLLSKESHWSRRGVTAHTVASGRCSKRPRCWRHAPRSLTRSSLTGSHSKTPQKHSAWRASGARVRSRSWSRSPSRGIDPWPTAPATR